jgi:putative acetyltransferase
MVEIIRTNSENEEFRKLVVSLDLYLALKDGADHSFYSQYNKLDAVKNAIVALDTGIAAGCGAFKEYSPDTVEIKRMYTSPASRGKGIATLILAELERWAAELSYKKCVLETGKRQPEAVALYKKNGYIAIPNYGQYIGMENSICFEKIIS